MRRDHHAYHDFSAPPEASSVAELPEQQFVDQRLAQAQLSRLNLQATKESGVPRPAPLVDRIPPVALPTTLSIGGFSREPIPVIPEERQLAQQAVEDGIGGVFGTFQHACPPPADTTYAVDDQGVSGPDFFRVSMYNVPVTEKLRDSTSLPLALYLRPFAREEVPLADFSGYDGETMPPRCRRCRAYMNPSMRFTHGGGKFVCNMCLFENPTPAEYFQPTNHENKRLDWMERPELSYGTYDFVVARPPHAGEGDDAPKYYGMGEGRDKGGGVDASIYGTVDQPFNHVFACEVGRDAVQKGILETFTTAVRDALPYLEYKIAIITFDGRVTHYRPTPAGPQLLVSNPGSEAVPPDVFYDPVTQREELLALLDLLPRLYADTTDRRSCLGDAVHSVTQLPHFSSGGRLTVVAASLPTEGTVKLVARDRAMTGLSPDAEHAMHKQLFNPTSPALTTIANELRDNGWGCDLLAIPTSSFMDLATLGELPRRTGGKLLHYPRFMVERDERRVIADILEITTLPAQARNAQLKIRTSTGLQISTKFRDPALDWRYLDSDSTLVVTCEYDGSLDPKLDTHFQAAILYTTPSGEKRVRICNQLAGVTSKVKAIIKYVDVDVVTMAIVRQTLARLGEHDLPMLRASVATKLHDIFGSVRRLVGYGVPESQLLMPTNLRMLPAYILAFMKSVVLGSRAFSIDARVANADLLMRADPVVQSLALYPRIYELDSETIRPKLARFDDIGGSPVPVLVFNGRELYLWLSHAVPPSVLRSFFGVEDLAAISPYLDEVEAVAPLGHAEALRVARNWVPLQIVRQGLDGAEYQLRQLMAEDAVGDAPSYMNFVVRIHEHAKKAIEEKSSWF